MCSRRVAHVSECHVGASIGLTPRVTPNTACFHRLPLWLSSSAATTIRDSHMADHSTCSSQLNVSNADQSHGDTVLSGRCPSTPKYCFDLKQRDEAPATPGDITRQKGSTDIGLENISGTIRQGSNNCRSKPSVSFSAPNCETCDGDDVKQCSNPLPTVSQAMNGAGSQERTV